MNANWGSGAQSQKKPGSGTPAQEGPGSAQRESGSGTHARKPEHRHGTSQGERPLKHTNNGQAPVQSSQNSDSQNSASPQGSAVTGGQMGNTPSSGTPSTSSMRKRSETNANWKRSLAQSLGLGDNFFM